MAYTLFNRQGEIEVEPNFVKSCQVFIDLFDDYDTDDNILRLRIDNAWQTLAASTINSMTRIEGGSF